ncbi:MAG: hypothetical protein M3N00_01625 [Actinomycetota bacterium]|nr:hypothetical protein [Actinomycetota bacterium]
MPLGEAAADLGTGNTGLWHEVHSAQQDETLRGVGVDQCLRSVGIEDLLVSLMGGVEVVRDRTPIGRAGPIAFGRRRIFVLCDAGLGIRRKFVGRFLLLGRRVLVAAGVIFFLARRARRTTGFRSELVLLGNVAARPRGATDREQHQSGSSYYKGPMKARSPPPGILRRLQVGVGSADQASERGGDAENEKKIAETDYLGDDSVGE